MVMVPLRLRVLHAAATIKAASTVAAAVGRDAVLAAKVRGQAATATTMGGGGTAVWPVLPPSPGRRGQRGRMRGGR